MRLNKFLAQTTGLSRRAADTAITNGEVFVNNQPATLGQEISGTDQVTYHGKVLQLEEYADRLTILLNKPAGYVVSRDGQGSRTIYDLLPPEYHQLKPVGRLDKDSSGLLLLTNDGQLAYELTHPKFHKTKIYEVALDKPLSPLHHQMINDVGVQLDDGRSQFSLQKLNESGTRWRVTMHEGRNRQIRRTFAALGYHVTRLHRTQFGSYVLGHLHPGASHSTT